LDISLLIVILVANIISMALFGLDKLWATRNGVRISESSLLTQSALGPFGALLGMVLFQHKTRKPKFLLVPLFILAQLTLLYYFQG